jgi:hypothetical protein
VWWLVVGGALGSRPGAAVRARLGFEDPSHPGPAAWRGYAGSAETASGELREAATEDEDIESEAESELDEAEDELDEVDEEEEERKRQSRHLSARDELEKRLAAGQGPPAARPGRRG